MCSSPCSNPLFELQPDGTWRIPHPRKGWTINLFITHRIVISEEDQWDTVVAKGAGDLIGTTERLMRSLTGEQSPGSDALQGSL